MTTRHNTVGDITPAVARQRAALDALVRARGLNRFAFFGTSGEGRSFPDGQEETSGSVFDDRGRVFDFWTAWDEARGEATFRTWREVEPTPRLAASASYRRARTAVGLPASGYRHDR
jgi:hypothetical protein